MIITADREKTERAWYKKKRWNIPIGLIVFFAIVGSCSDDTETGSSAQPEVAAAVEPSATPTPVPTQPDYAGQPVSAVYDALENRNIDVDMELVSNTRDDYQDKNVILYTTPRAGAEINEDTKVTLYYVTRATYGFVQKKSKMPKLTGRSQDRVQKQLDKLGIDYDVDYVDGKKGQTKNKVVKQSPRPGKPFNLRTRVKITVSEEDYMRDFGGGSGGSGGGSVDLPNHIPGNLCRSWWC